MLPTSGPHIGFVYRAKPTGVQLVLEWVVGTTSEPVTRMTNLSPAVGADCI